jgi:ribosomal protein L28
MFVARRVEFDTGVGNKHSYAQSILKVVFKANIFKERLWVIRSYILQN